MACGSYPDKPQAFCSPSCIRPSPRVMPSNKTGIAGVHGAPAIRTGPRARSWARGHLWELKRRSCRGPPFEAVVQALMALRLHRLWQPGCRRASGSRSLGPWLCVLGLSTDLPFSKRVFEDGPSSSNGSLIGAKPTQIFWFCPQLLRCLLRDDFLRITGLPKLCSKPLTQFKVSASRKRVNPLANGLGRQDNFKNPSPCR